MDDKNENICGEQDGEEIKLSREKGKERERQRGGEKRGIMKRRMEGREERIS